MLSQLFGSQLRAKLLGWLLSHPGESFFIRQLHHLIRQDPTNISRELRRLERMGIVTSENRANAKYYTVNQGCPIYPELKGLFLKTAGVSTEIREVLKHTHNIDAAFIYGSVASGTERPESDVDLMVIGTIGLREVIGLLGDLPLRIGREVNPHVLTPHEFHKRAREGDHFIRRILGAPRLFIIGGEDGLETMG
jgi:predicted nucleotidyltransferase